MNSIRSQPPRLKQSFSQLDFEAPLDLSQIKWIYLRHPSGRIHRINADCKPVIEILLRWRWKRVTSKQN